jgi:hypothetical protein
VTQAPFSTTILIIALTIILGAFLLVALLKRRKRCYAQKGSAPPC